MFYVLLDLYHFTLECKVWGQGIAANNLKPQTPTASSNQPPAVTYTPVFQDSENICDRCRNHLRTHETFHADRKEMTESFDLCPPMALFRCHYAYKCMRTALAL